MKPVLSRFDRNANLRSLPAVVAQSPPIKQQRLPWYARAIMIAMGAGLIGLLCVAMTLTPSPQGFGTHTQIPGLMPCSFTQIAGLRCPSCGMTTSWAHFVRGQFVGALRANSGGTLLALLAAISGPWMLASGLRGWWLLKRPNEWLAVGVAVSIVVVTLIDWGIRLSMTVGAGGFGTGG